MSNAIDYEIPRRIACDKENAQRSFKRLPHSLDTWVTQILTKLLRYITQKIFLNSNNSIQRSGVKLLLKRN